MGAFKIFRVGGCEMTKEEMYNYIRENLPEIAEKVDAQIAWLDGDDDVLHIVIGGPFIDFLKEMMRQEWGDQDRQLMQRVFELFDKMICDDVKVSDVLYSAIIDYIVTEPNMVDIYWEYMSEELRVKARAIYYQTTGKKLVTPAV